MGTETRSVCIAILLFGLEQRSHEQRNLLETSSNHLPYHVRAEPHWTVQNEYQRNPMNYKPA